MKIENIQRKLNETANNKYFAEWDEDIEDNRLHLDCVHFDSGCDLTEQEYNKIIKFADKFEIKRKGYIIYFTYDGSGYEYWYKQQAEGNYLGVTISIEDIKKIRGREIEAMYKNVVNMVHKLTEKGKDITKNNAEYYFNFYNDFFGVVMYKERVLSL